VRPTHHFKNRIVPKWCVGRTLPIGLNFSRSHARRGNAGSGDARRSVRHTRRRASWRHSHAERGNEKKQ